MNSMVDKYDSTSLKMSSKKISSDSQADQIFRLPTSSNPSMLHSLTHQKETPIYAMDRVGSTEVQPTLWPHPDFTIVLKTIPDLAFDFGTKRAKEGAVWCSVCKQYGAKSLSKYCICSFSNMCGRSNFWKHPESP